MCLHDKTIGGLGDIDDMGKMLKNISRGKKSRMLGGLGLGKFGA